MSDSLRQTILEILSSEDTYVSGQELSRKLGVSRTAIWKHINILREKGYGIDSISNKGYRLESTPEEFIPEEILRNLKTELLGKEIVFYEKVDSTNSRAKEEAFKYPEGTVFLAERQENGRGRLGRNWSSKPGKGIWASILLKPSLKPEAAGQFPLLVSAAVTMALESEIDVKIKWPNDLLIGDKKVCGILTEMGAEIDQINYLIIGTGLNVKHRSGDFPEEIHSIATSLEMASGKSFSRVRVLCDILYSIEKYYFLFLEKGFEPIRKIWKEYSCTLGNDVRISNFNSPDLYGKAVDLDTDGSLLIKLPGGEMKKIVSGEIINQA